MLLLLLMLLKLVLLLLLLQLLLLQLLLLVLLLILDLLKRLLLSYVLVWDWLWDNTHGDCLRRRHCELHLLSRIGRRRTPHGIVGQEL